MAEAERYRSTEDKVRDVARSFGHGVSGVEQSHLWHSDATGQAPWFHILRLLPCACARCTCSSVLSILPENLVG